MSLSLATQSTGRIDTSTFNKSIRCKQMYSRKKVGKVIDKLYYLKGVRIVCAGVSDCLSEFPELSQSNYLGLVQTYALAYAYVLGRGRTPDVFFFPVLPFGANYGGATVYATCVVGRYFRSNT